MIRVEPGCSPGAYRGSEMSDEQGLDVGDRVYWVDRRSVQVGDADRYVATVESGTVKSVRRDGTMAYVETYRGDVLIETTRLHAHRWQAEAELGE